MNKKNLAELAKLRDDMTKTYGNAVTRQESVKFTYECISTGSISLDVATVVGGLPLGRMVVYWGQEGCGKTTACIHAMKEAQLAYPDRVVGYIDMEQTFDWTWARNNGLDIHQDRLLHVYPDNSEDVSDQIKKMVSTGLFSLIVVDSIGGMESKKAFEKDADESNMGKNAQIITRMMKACAVQARKQQTAMIFVSQVRADFKSHTGFDTFAGPKSVRHSNSMVIKFSRTGTPMLTIKVGQDTVPVGKEFKAKVDRSKVGPEGRSGTFLIINQETEKYGPVGLDYTDEMVAMIDLLDLVPRRGSWYDLDNGDEVNGREKLKVYLRDHPEVVSHYRTKALATKASEVIPEETVEFAFAHSPEEATG